MALELWYYTGSELLLLLLVVYKIGNCLWLKGGLHIFFAKIEMEVRLDLKQFLVGRNQ